MMFFPRLVLPSALAALSACALSSGGAGDARARYFAAQVKPVLQQHCLQCHNGRLPVPALDLSSREGAFRRSTGGRACIVPGKPDRSLLITAVQRGGTHPKMMPRTDVSLTEDQIGALREWIEDGAFWPEGKAGLLHAQKSVENP